MENSNDANQPLSWEKTAEEKRKIRKRERDRICYK